MPDSRRAEPRRKIGGSFPEISPKRMEWLHRPPCYELKNHLTDKVLFLDSDMQASKATYTRDRLSGRQIRRGISSSIAADAIGPIEPGCEIFGLNKGKFSLVDIISHCLQASGPSDVTISTWTAAGADLGFAYGLMTDGAIRSLRFIVDFSFPTRQPQYCAALRERFGDECIRVTKTHAKFVLIRNERWNLVIRSSMNLNENKRLESFEISDHAGMAEFLAGVVESLLGAQPEGKGFTNTPYQNVMEFERFGEGLVAETVTPDLAASTDTRKYFGNGRYDADLRRAGMTYEK